MGEFTQTIRVSGLNGGPSVEVEALVGTRATFTVLPASLLREIGIVPDREIEFELGDQRTVDYEVGQAQLTIEGSSAIASVVFGPEDVGPLLGVVTLAAMALLVDPVAQRLVPRRVLRM